MLIESNTRIEPDESAFEQLGITISKPQSAAGAVAFSEVTFPPDWAVSEYSNTQILRAMATRPDGYVVTYGLGSLEGCIKSLSIRKPESGDNQ